jgi:hypothetical protein
MKKCKCGNEISESLQALEKLEGNLWMSHLLSSLNPVLVEGGIFIGRKFDIISEDEAERIPHMSYSQLTALEVSEAESLAVYFSTHSNETFNELADWIPQWMVERRVGYFPVHGTNAPKLK